MKNKLKAVFLLILLMPVLVQANTFFELSSAIGERQLDIFRKEAADDSDDAKYVGFTAAAYRSSGGRAAWGGVIEAMLPIQRENETGSGLILGVRPVNFLYRWQSWLETELFFGAAQYDWIKKATGFYLGGNARYRFGREEKFAVALEYRYFQDLAHDGGPGGDQIVDGPALGLNFYYRFGD